jgi:HlyD family secretion protein
MSEPDPPALSEEPRLAIPANLTDRPRRRRRLLWLGAALAILAIIVTARAVLATRTAASYLTEPIERRTIVHRVEAMGHLDVPERVEVPAPVAGRITSILAKPGQRVRRGELLAQLDPAEADLALDSAQQGLKAGASRAAEARAALASAVDANARTKHLAARGLASQADLMAARATEERARAALDEATAQRAVTAGSVTSAALARQMTAIRALADGVVLEAPERIGAPVSPSSGKLFVLGSSTDRMRIDVAVAEGDIADVRADQTAHFTVPAFPRRTFLARVARVDNEGRGDRGLVSYTVTLEVDNREHLLLPGMTASVRIDVAEVKDALAVREAALRFAPPGATSAAEQPGQTRLWRLGPDNRLETVPVTVGIGDGAYSEVHPRPGKALAAGERVVIGAVAPRSKPTGPGVELGGR